MHLRSKKVTISPKTRTNTEYFHSSNSEPCFDSERNAPSNEVLNKDNEIEINEIRNKDNEENVIQTQSKTCIHTNNFHSSNSEPSFSERNAPSNEVLNEDNEIDLNEIRNKDNDENVIQTQSKTYIRTNDEVERSTNPRSKIKKGHYSIP